MAGLGKVTITLDEETHSIFTATRVNTCKASTCKHNTAYRSWAGADLTCSLKRAVIGDDGKCENYEFGE